MNEPNLLTQMAYEYGMFPPAHCTPHFAKLYRERFKSKVDDFLSISVSAFMFIPLRNNSDDKDAVNRALAFNVASTLDPLVYGDYPPDMRRYHGDELPTFTLEKRALLKDNVDFVGINHYSTLYGRTASI